MGKRERHTRIERQFAVRTIDMLRSPAFRVLSLSARRVLDRIEIEFADHGGKQNGSLPVTYADFQRYGIDLHAIAPAIREAEALGFIEITERGRAGNAEFRSPHKFRLTYRHTPTAKATEEWERIQTIEEAQATAIRARKPPDQKQKTTAGKSSASLGGTHIEKVRRPLGETHSTGEHEKPTVPSISRVGSEA
jgi:hypothetical protein